VADLIQVLLISSSPTDTLKVREALGVRVSSFQLTYAERLSEGLSCLSTQSFHAILIDAALPDSDGLDNLRRLKRQAPKTPIIVLTNSEEEEETFLEAATVDAYECLRKSFVTGPALLRIISDSTQRQQVQEALSELQVRYQNLYDNAPDMLCSVDAQTGTIIECNQTFGRVAGYTKDEILGRHIVDVCQPDSVKAAQDVFKSFLRTGAATNAGLQIRKKDATKIDVIVNVSAVRDEHGAILFGRWSLRDITSRKRTQQRVQAQHEVTRILAGSNRLAESVAEVLRVICQTLGWEMGAVWLIDQNELYCVDIWLSSGLDASELVSTIRSQRLAPGVGLPGRVWRSARPEWISNVTQDPNRAAFSVLPEVPAAVAFPILVGNECLGVLEFFSREFRQLDADVVQIIGAVGSQMGQVLRRQRAEQTAREQEEQLRRSQKMDAIGQLAGGVAHDFNNLLTVINGYTDLALGRLVAEDPLRVPLSEVRKAGDRAASLTRQLLAFSSKQVLEPTILDLNVVVNEMHRMLRRVIGEHIELNLLLDPGLGQVRADATQIEQIIVNLAVNARDAMPSGGRLVLETANVTIDGESRSTHHIDHNLGPCVMLAISDSGIGMDRETLSHIFEPFFTTKEKGKGTGLGLAMVFGIVKQSGGRIWVQSEPNRGTTFTIYLPRVWTEPPPETATAAIEKSHCGSETILVAEDETAVRGLAVSVLSSDGYTVLDSHSCAEALRICREHTGPIALLLTDVVMPQLSGRELAAKISVLRPDIRILYMSGYTEDTVILNGMAEPGTAFISKPFSPRGLLSKVREVLDAPSFDRRQTSEKPEP
jgi:two-component system cell cycle sensor histidine kinase/response regulator CckA